MDKKPAEKKAAGRLSTTVIICWDAGRWSIGYDSKKQNLREEIEKNSANINTRHYRM